MGIWIQWNGMVDWNSGGTGMVEWNGMVLMGFHLLIMNKDHL